MSQQHRCGPPAGGHPRRPPAHKSVSLLHSSGKRKHGQDADESRLSRPASEIPASDKANPSSSGPSKPGTKKESSGETSDAGKWFEHSNNNIIQNSASFVDNGSPFFFRNSSSSTSPDTRIPLHMHLLQQASIPERPALMNMCTDESSTEEFRGVIDDLTVENKKLRRRLKRYEKTHDAHLQEEKLFEVRVHGLPPHKKRELEETLRKFAMELDDNSASEPAGLTYERPSFHTQPAMSSHTSTQFADSGYQSVSASGQHSNAPSGGHDKPKKMTKSQFHRQQDSIQSYLQDIPLGLMPKTVAMTETAKKKLVVRRMEQIFAGKGAGISGHQQPMQQQEVAQSAAQADRRALERAAGQEALKEGTREALIMSEMLEDATPAEMMQQLTPGHMVQDREFAASPKQLSLDQRPTRPLDLDPQRAQIPADNMNYIRHLGFSPLHPEMPPEDGHGWIYLNLLINMAQLHTINVTADFVKTALHKYSRHLELSDDGRKVRWRGGQDVSFNSNESSPHQEMEVFRPNVKRLGQKRRKLGPRSTGDSSEAAQSSERAQWRSNPFAYTPLFYRKESTDESGMEQGSSDEASQMTVQPTGNSSGFASSGVRTSSAKGRREDGPIIFYNKAKFCTDLSGDRNALSSRGHTSYTHYTNVPIGGTPEPTYKGVNITYNDDRRGPLARAALQDMDVDPSSSSDIELEFASGPLPIGKASPEPKEEIDFEASGIGGVVPHDNFAIDVECRQVRDDKASATNGASHVSRPKHYPDKIMEALNDDGENATPSAVLTKRKAPIINGEIISARRKELPPSELPPPSLLPFDDTSGDADSDTDSEMSEADDEYDLFSEPPTAAPRPMDVSSRSQASISDVGDEEDEDDDADMASEGSLDFLAAARAIDPESIRQQEREYDSNMAERLAEEIPAGSSAATAGGGSGFNSPALDLRRDGGAEERRPANGGSAS